MLLINYLGMKRSLLNVAIVHRDGAYWSGEKRGGEGERGAT